MFDGGETKFGRNAPSTRKREQAVFFAKNDIVVRRGGFFKVVKTSKPRFRRAWVQTVGPDGAVRGVVIYESYDTMRLATDEEKKSFFTV